MNRVWNKIGNRNLWISFTFALVIHLFFILCASALFSGVEVRQPALRFVKVTLHPIEEEKKAAPEVSPPVKSPGKKSERREAAREEKRVEPLPPVQKDEMKPPVPLPVQSVEREIPVEEPKPVSSSQLQPLTVVAALGTDLSFRKEEVSPPPSPPPHPRPIEGNVTSGPVPEEKTAKTQEGPEGNPGKEQERDPDRKPGNGSGMERGGFSWKGLGSDGSGAGRSSGGGGSGNGTGTGPDSASGSGSGKNTGRGDGPGAGTRKGTGFFAKLFSSAGGPGRGNGGASTGGVPRYAENPKPPYPQEARERGHQGEVLLRVEVLSNGRVGQIEINRSSGHDALDRSALSTVKQWKFIPGKRGEDPVSSWVIIPIKFQLQ